VVAECKWAIENFPGLQEIFFDDDTFNYKRERTIEICKKLEKLNFTFSCTSRVTTDEETLKAMKAAGFRLLIVGFESGDAQVLKNIKKGATPDMARRFARNAHKLGLLIHGDFIIGLPGETRESVRKTIDFAKELDCQTIQVSLAAPYPGTFLYNQAVENNWLDVDHAELIDDHGVQMAPLHYPHLSHTEIFNSVETFYRRFYFRAPKIASIVGEMVRSPDMMKRRLREGVEFFQFLKERKGGVAPH
jgi:radical SAM superfamily enzyme YgiQ (UPF0313 family)